MTTVLLVEDNVDNARALTRLLTRRGFSILWAATGKDALATAREAKPDIILMDIGLPDIDGLEVTRRVKADPNVAMIPVIALTAHAMSHDKTAALAAGCIDFAPKPVNLPELLKSMRAFATEEG